MVLYVRYSITNGNVHFIEHPLTTVLRMTVSMELSTSILWGFSRTIHIVCAMSMCVCVSKTWSLDIGLAHLISSRFRSECFELAERIVRQRPTQKKIYDRQRIDLCEGTA